METGMLHPNIKKIWMVSGVPYHPTMSADVTTYATTSINVNPNIALLDVIDAKENNGI